MRLTKFAKKKIGKCVVAFLGIFLLSILIEIVGFNFNIIFMDEQDKGVHHIEFNDLELIDMSVDADGVFNITGESPSFKISTVDYISYLSIVPEEESSSFHVNPSTQRGGSGVAKSVKEESCVFAGEDSEDIVFNVSVDDGNSCFLVEEIRVENTLLINWVRVYAMLSIGILISYFIIFKKIINNKLHITFLVIALLFGSNVVFMMPKSNSYDEKEHFVRAYQISRFDFGIKENEIPWIEEAEEFFEYWGFANTEHYNYLERVNFIEKFDEHDYTNVEYYHTTAETYPFVPYAFQAIGILIARLLGMSFVHTFYSGRLFGLLGYALICFTAIKYAKEGKRLMFVLGLLPSMIYTASAYSADPMTMAFSLLSFTVIQNMIFGKKKIDYRLPLVFSLCIAMVVMCKVTYVPLCILILAVPSSAFANKRREWLTKAAVIGFCGLVAIGTFAFGSIKGINQWHIPGTDTVGQVKYILANISTYCKIMWDHVSNHWLVYFTGSSISMAYSGDLRAIWAFLSIGIMFTALISDCHSNNSYKMILLERLLLIVAVIGSWVLVLTALYVSFTPVGMGSISGVQGRYFAPLIFPLLLAIKPKNVDCNWSSAKTNFVLSIMSCLLLSVVVVTLFRSYCY